MKHFAMTRRKDYRSPPAPRPEEDRSGGEEGDKTSAAFDVWLQRGLHQLFDGVAQEPIPEDLLRLIEDDRALQLPHGKAKNP